MHAFHGQRGSALRRVHSGKNDLLSAFSDGVREGDGGTMRPDYGLTLKGQTSFWSVVLTFSLMIRTFVHPVAIMHWPGRSWAAPAAIEA